MRLSSPVAIIAAPPTSASFEPSQRVRVTLWVQARRKLPVSSSRAMSGAPQKIPISAGTMKSSAVIAFCRKRSVWTKLVMAVAQSRRVLQVATVEL
jgi:hypothetical protein